MSSGREMKIGRGLSSRGWTLEQGFHAENLKVLQGTIYMDLKKQQSLQEEES